jgi:hypothetical protein
MSFPASLTVRKVKGRFVTYPDGAAAKGKVRIVLENFLQGPTDDLFVAPFDETLELDETGSFSIMLPATNDPQWTSSHYRVTIDVQTRCVGAYPYSFETKRISAKLDVPYTSTADIDLADVLNLPASTPGESYILLASKGVPGGVAMLGNDGKVPLSQLPASSGGSVSWNDLTDKPATFPHDEVTFGQVTGKPTSYPSSWTDVAGKPSTFAPTAHVHPTSDVTGLDTALASKVDSAYVLAAIVANGPKIVVLGPSDPIPGGTPAGTLIIRTES